LPELVKQEMVIMNKEDSVKITILYDNNCLAGFKASWGFSCLIETNTNTILFDTGWDGNVLLHNLKLAGVKLETIDLVVISHSHWDHMGGLAQLLPLLKDPTVVFLKSFSPNLKGEIRARSKFLEIEKVQEIADGVWTTGELGKKIKEQSILIELDKKKVLITGCAHPDLKSIIDTAGKIGDGKLMAIIGGFHNSKKLEMLEGIEVVVPCHCTQRKDEIHRMYPNSYTECAVGKIFKFP